MGNQQLSSEMEWKEVQEYTNYEVNQHGRDST